MHFRSWDHNNLKEKQIKINYEVKSLINSIHYQKINKYKRKYQGNIFIGKFPRDFTDGNIPSVYTDGITMGIFFKTKQKKTMTCHFLPTELPTDPVGKSVGKLWTLFIMSITKGITDGIFRRYSKLFTFQLHY